MIIRFLKTPNLHKRNVLNNKLEHLSLDRNFRTNLVRLSFFRAPRISEHESIAHFLLEARPFFIFALPMIWFGIQKDSQKLTHGPT
jgi:hypothetical protein